MSTHNPRAQVTLARLRNLIPYETRVARGGKALIDAYRVIQFQNAWPFVFVVEGGRLDAILDQDEENIGLLSDEFLRWSKDHLQCCDVEGECDCPVQFDFHPVGNPVTRIYMGFRDLSMATYFKMRWL